MNKKLIFIILGVVIVISAVFIFTLILVKPSSKKTKESPTPPPTVEIPATFPKDIPIYPNKVVKKATISIIESFDYTKPSRHQALLWLETTDPIGTISDFYKKDTIKQGWKLKTLNETLSRMDASFSKDKRELIIRIKKPGDVIQGESEYPEQRAKEETLLIDPKKLLIVIEELTPI